MGDIRETRRAEVLEKAADHLLSAGIAGASLRALAASSGTSDRMLMYYFSTKEELITAALGVIAGRLAVELDRIPASDPQRLLHALAELLRGPRLSAYMRLWLDIAARAAWREEPYRSAGGLIADGFAAWLAARLDGDPATRHARAARMIATLDGIVLLDAVGRTPTGDAALDPAADAGET